MTDYLALITATVRDVYPDRFASVDADTRLVGALSSMELVMLLAELEVVIESATGHTVTIADERALSRASSPFATVGALAAFLGERLG